MSERRRFAFICAILAVAACVVFFAVSIDHDVYAPGARQLHNDYGDVFNRIRPKVPERFRGDINPYFLLRKSYSIVAFSILGLLVAPALRKRRRVLDSGLAVGGFSTLIEIGQKLSGAAEGLESNAFDVGCGVIGGVIGALIWNGVRRFRSPNEREVRR